MPRVQRIRGEFSTYHVMQWGNEKKTISGNNVVVRLACKSRTVANLHE